jgi:MFS family permease
MPEAPLYPAPACDLVGTARLRVVVLASAIGFLCSSLLEYSLPLYFPAAGLPESSWERWGSRSIFAWMCGPALAAVIASRLGERRAWALGLASYVLLPPMLVALPRLGPWAPWMLDLAALWYGAVAALVWIGGISLAQIVPQRRKSLSNAATMTAVALGATVAPLIGRALLGWSAGDQTRALARDFHVIFALYGVAAALGAALVYWWGQRDAAGDGPCPADTRPRTSLRESLSLLRSRRFLATVIALGLLTGPVFQATNVYRAYRAAEPYIGLIVAARDHGFAFLQSAGYVAQLLGGLLIGLLAGRRANRVTGAIILATFTVCQVGIGLAPGAVVLILCSALFEMMRQLVRWSQTGFISELVPEEHRGLAISVTVMLSGLGGWLFMVVARALQTPDAPGFSSTLPFLVAAAPGVVGVGLLLFTHRVVQQRQ